MSVLNMVRRERYALVMVAALLVAMAASEASALQIFFAGRDAGVAGTNNDSVDRWRTASVAKPFDADADSIYGTAGYVLYATDTVGNANGGNVQAANPLTFVNTTRKTISSIPSFLTLANNGQDQIATSFGYKQVDDPTSAGDVESGAALRSATKGTEVSMLNIVFNASAPDAVRIGLFIGNTDSYDGTLRLSQTIGGIASATTLQLNSGTEDLYFFDVFGAKAGDQLTLFLTKDSAAAGNANVLYGGVTFDVFAIPEPATISCLGLASLALAARRRRMA